MLTTKKRYKNRTMRAARTAQGIGTRNDVVTPSTVTATAAHVGSTLTVVFSTPVVYAGILPGWTNNGQHVIGVTMTDPQHATLTFSGATAAGATVVGFQDPSFRTMSGGFVQPGTITAT